MKPGRLVVGWREWIRLPELEVDWIKAKVDTGARTSALHAENIRYVRRAGKRWVRFTIHPRQRSKVLAVEALAPVLEERVVRSSSGEQESRPVIRTEIDVRGEVWPIELTLTRRDVMGFRMLLGREAIRGRALVDSGRSYLTRRVVRKK